MSNTIYLLLWGWTGILLHHFLFATKLKRYDWLGYLLSILLGPVVFFAIKENDAMGSRDVKLVLVWRVLFICFVATILFLLNMGKWI